MRIADIATGLAAVVAVPLAIQASAPSMSQSEFVSAVRCTAYEQAAAPRGALSEVKLALNAEARRQPLEAVAAAAAEARAARQAVITANGADASMLGEAASCGAGLIAQDGIDGSEA